MALPLSNGGKRNSDTVSTALPNRKPDTSSTPRMLTPSEIASLRQSKQENNRFMLETV